MTLIIINDQGASETTHHTNISEVIEQVRTWAEPYDLTARVYDDDVVCLYDDAAGYLADNDSIEDAMEQIEIDNNVND